MRWSGATGAIARCKRVSTGCGRTRRSVRVLRWIWGVKPTPKAVNKPLHHFIVHGLDKPGSSATVSTLPQVRYGLSMLLLEVFCTPGIDSICRQVQRQLLRNELARFYHHRTRKWIPQRKLRREIQ